MAFVYKLLNTNILVFNQKNTRRQNSVNIFWCIMYKNAQLFLFKIFIIVITQKKINDRKSHVGRKWESLLYSDDDKSILRKHCEKLYK